jgi:hypothetical protein
VFNKCKHRSDQVIFIFKKSFFNIFFYFLSKIFKKRFIIEHKVDINAKNRLGCSGKINDKKIKKKLKKIKKNNKMNKLIK